MINIVLHDIDPNMAMRIRKVAVIAAMETVPNDPGFSLIGRIERAADAETEAPREFDPDELERALRDVPRGSTLGGDDGV